MKSLLSKGLIGCGVLAYVGGLAISATIPSAGLVSIATASALLIAALVTIVVGSL